jgi:hypothetical protein
MNSIDRKPQTVILVAKTHSKYRMQEGL